MGKYRLNSSLIVKKDQREKLVNMLLKASKSIEKLGECDIYNIMVSKEDPNLVFIYEEWFNESAYITSRSLDLIKNLNENTKPMISGFVKTQRQGLDDEFKDFSPFKCLNIIE
ncbi:hypothetical protein PH210_05125 [Paenibacillus sp. BSR1-1]|uniref:putative quinol monooxygenase n=1 Tax=Paenibacillus sp. BSR1-1 TaxID=3020845 RepID=UPI0025B0AE85|nr:hypothetical protein [Paenibacillus sp. BSR1-1]MDN3015590.1 hypothetical protein [Paenibacillus sp. BSR1-1]